jgi:hypothetical protein
VDQPETLIEPKTPTEAALAEAAEKIIEAVAPKVLSVSGEKLNIYQLIRLYEFGKDRLKSREWDRWREVFALAVSVGGVWVTYVGDSIGYLGIFWRTKNINVDLSRGVPVPDAAGAFAYIGGHWNESGLPLLKKFRDHVIAACPGIDFIAGHDHRAKLSRARRGKPWVLKVKSPRGES